MDSLRLQLKQHTAQDSNRADLLNNLAYLYHPFDPQMTEALGREALTLSDSISYRRGKVGGLMSLGIAYWAMGEYDLSLKHHLEAQKIIEEYRYEEKLPLSLNSIGMVYYEQGNYNDALDYFEQCMEKAKGVQDESLYGISMRNAGRTYQKKGKPEKALNYLYSSLDIANRLGDKRAEGQALNAIGETHLFREEYELAMKHLRKSSSIGEEIGDFQILTSSLSAIGMSYANMGDFDKAKLYLDNALIIANKITAKDRKLKIYLGYLKMYELKGDYKNALKYHKMKLALKDSLFSKFKNNQIARLKVEYETEKRILENKFLKLDHQKKDSRIKRQKILVISIGILFFLVAISAFFILKANMKAVKKSELLEIQQGEMIMQSKKIERANWEILRQNRQLEMVNQKLVSINHEKNDLIDIVAHDLKSPMNQIIGILNLIEPKPESEMDKYLSMIRNAAQNSVNMIDRILNVHEMSQGLTLTSLNREVIRSIIDKSIEDFQVQAVKKGIDIHLTDTEDDFEVALDETYFRQAVNNLISNAIKFSQKDKAVFLSLKKSDEEMLFSVKDQGPGIEKGELQNLFIKYKKLNAHPTDGESSTGIGLSIVKKFTEEMKGRVWCESEEGKGATFFMAFPIQEREDDEEAPLDL